MSDQALRGLIDLRNKAEGLIYSASRTLEEFAADVDESDRKAISDQIEKTRAQLSGEDPEALESALDQLSRLSYGLTERLYATLGGADEDLGKDADDE